MVCRPGTHQYVRYVKQVLLSDLPSNDYCMTSSISGHFLLPGSLITYIHVFHNVSQLTTLTPFDMIGLEVVDCNNEFSLSKSCIVLDLLKWSAVVLHDEIAHIYWGEMQHLWRLFLCSSCGLDCITGSNEGRSHKWTCEITIIAYKSVSCAGYTTCVLLWCNR